MFVLIIERLTDEIRQKAPWLILFADDIILCGENRVVVEDRLEEWREA